MQLGPYVLSGELGQGAFSSVYAARHQATQRLFALKVLSEEGAGDAECLQGFLREVELQREVDHPNVVRVHEVACDEGLHYQVHDLVVGPTLEDVLSDGRLDLRGEVRLLAQVARAVNAIHARGIAHRDVKPANVLVTRDNLPRLTDFGRAARIRDDAPGTPSHSVVSAASLATDVYALGVIFQRSLAAPAPSSQGGRKPSPGHSRPTLEALCREALAPQARDRPTALAIAERLERWLDEPKSEAGTWRDEPAHEAGKGRDEPATPPRVSPSTTTLLPQPSPTAPANEGGIQAGSEIAGYRIVSPLGAGAMGEVYLALQPGTEREVALKVVPLKASSESASSRCWFQQEARALGRLRHPNVIRVHTAGVVGNLGYLVLTYVEGQTLEDRLESGALPPREAARLIRDAARGAGHAHSLGIVHRDLKPANLLIDRTGRVQVADFGVAHIDALPNLATMSAIGLTRDGAVLGSPGYLSPEQVCGDSARVTAASDVFALGVTLYEALTGERPFEGATLAELAVQIINKNPDPPSALCSDSPAALDGVCLKALAKDPLDRYDDACGLADDLDRFLGGALHRADPWFQGLVPALGGVAVLLGCVALAGYATRKPPAPDPGQVRDPAPPPVKLTSAQRVALERANVALRRRCPEDALATLAELPAESSLARDVSARAHKLALSADRVREDVALALLTRLPEHIRAAQAQIARRADRFPAQAKLEALHAALRAAETATGERNLAGAPPEARCELPTGLGPLGPQTELPAESRRVESQASAERNADRHGRSLSLREGLLVRHPNHEGVRADYSKALAQSHRTSEALRELVLTTASSPAFTDDLAQRLLRLCEYNNPLAVFQAARKIPDGSDPAFAAAIRASVTSARALLGPGGTFRSSRIIGEQPRFPPLELEGALFDVDRALQRYPAWFALRAVRGLLRLRLGHEQDALRDLHAFEFAASALVQRPAGRALHLVATILASSGKKREALGYLSRAANAGVAHIREWGGDWALESLRTEARFRALVGGAGQRAPR
jgi:serine/threonine protein kinase